MEDKRATHNRNDDRFLDEKIKDGAEKVKEDLKGSARRIEGELTNDQGLKTEHDPSTLEKVGNAIYDAGVAAKDKLAQTAEDLGITRKN